MRNETKEKRATFTPGPWTSAWVGTKPHGSAVVWLGENTNRRIEVSTRFLSLAAGIGRDEANARLIAAAPELHAQAKVLERLLVELSMEGETRTDEALDEVRAVLAKVDGGEG